MPIVHRDKSDKYNFTKVPNEIINNKELSTDAIVVAIWLASKLKSWNIVKVAIQNQFKISKERVNKVFDQLLAAKYLSVSEDKGDDGRFIALEYTFYVNPEMNPKPYKVEKGNKSKSTKKSKSKSPKKSKQATKTENNCSSSNEQVDSNPPTVDTSTEVPAEDVPPPEKPATEKPVTDEPSSENEKLTNTNSLNNTDRLYITDKQHTESNIDLALFLKEFNEQEKSLLLDEFKKVDVGVSIQIMEEFIYRRGNIKAPIAWIRNLIVKSIDGQFYPTHQSLMAFELEKFKKIENAKKSNEAIKEATIKVQEQKVREQTKGFEDAGPQSALKVMKG